MRNGEIKNKTTIPMLDLRAQYRLLKPEIENAIKEILESGHFILGPNVEALEKETAQYHGVKYALGLASCTDALHLSLKALGIKNGDEVITTPFTFIATAEAIAYVGAVPVFADIHRETLNIDPSQIEKKITPRTKAVIPVHLFGQPADMSEISQIARKYNLKVIEDCAQAFGAQYKGFRSGNTGDVGCFSFYPSKNLGAYGDGGMVITNNQEIFEKIKLLRNHSTTAPYRHSSIGYNSRLDEIQAAILRIKLRHIDSYNQKRREIARLYTTMLNSTVQCPVELPDRIHVYHQYTIRSLNRTEIQNFLNENSVSSVIYYPVPLHLQEAFKYLGHKEGNFPEAESAAREVLSLPIYPELQLEQVKFIAEQVLKTVKG
ncbi:MAG: DegT/DnrJ/EryC1/StrS family aminotransferase [Nitrospirae bacterium]|nr:DegT/DnrJ/EryC1/StrS family aminotransferase [Nitrospirota bacterium]